MESIRFTTSILGLTAANRLEKHQVTQTLRSEDNSITTAIINGQVSAGDLVEVTLNGMVVGHAELLILDAINWDGLDIDDAHRGGFDSLDDLASALKRAGFRFQPLNHYHLFRIRFSWLEAA